MLRSRKVQTGSLLIAEPFMQDENFKRSVVLITDHHEEGTVGFVLNRPIRVNIKQLLSDFPNFPARVFSGGPVQRDTIHYIHTAGDILDGSIPLGKGLYWGGDFDKLKFLISSEVISPFDIRFFVGYSGWGAEQLNSEIEEHRSWIIAESDPNYVFYNVKEVDLWQQVLDHKGNQFSVLSTIPDTNWSN